MSTSTTNYKLFKPELTDPADITQINVNWDKIDDELIKKAPLDENGKIPVENLPDEVGSVKSVNGFVGEVKLYTYGTEDLTAGVSPLETGKLHFVYE